MLMNRKMIRDNCVSKEEYVKEDFNLNIII